MKKILFTLMIVLVMLFGTVTACAETPENAVFSPEGSVLFEKDGVKVTTAGLDTDPTTEDRNPIIWLDIENTGSKDACLGVADGVVNGFTSQALFIDFYMEDGKYTSVDYTFNLTIPAGSSGRYGLGYYKTGVPGADLDVLGEMELCFTMAEDEYTWPNYKSEPVRIVTGEAVEDVDISALGTVVLDDEKLTLVVGGQDYDDFLGPMVYVYAANKSGNCLYLTANSAEADGVSCDYILFGETAAPSKKAASFMNFDGELQKLRGFENLTLTFALTEAAAMDELTSSTKAEVLDPVSVQYPPQVWGEYENGGLTLEIKPKYNDLITVETPGNDEKGILFNVSETASLEAGGFDGAGWLFSIGKVSGERLREMLCADMSGAQVFAKAADGGYYIYYHPTDVRYARASVEDMRRDQKQWSMLCEWASSVPDSLAEKNGLARCFYGNTEVDIAVARAAWADDGGVTLSTTEYGPVEIKGVDGSPYAEFVLRGGFFIADPKETPDGEYVVLSFPERDIRFDFFRAPGSYVRVVDGDRETLYQATFNDESVSYAEAMEGWYYAALEQAGIKAPDGNLAPFCGTFIHA